MAKDILTITFEDGSLLVLRLRKSGGYVIYYEDAEEEEATKLASLSEEVGFDIAKSIFFTIADRWGWEEEEEDNEDEDNDDEEDNDEDEDN